MLVSQDLEWWKERVSIFLTYEFPLKHVKHILKYKVNLIEEWAVGSITMINVKQSLERKCNYLSRENETITGAWIANQSLHVEDFYRISKTTSKTSFDLLMSSVFGMSLQEGTMFVCFAWG